MLAELTYIKKSIELEGVNSNVQKRIHNIYEFKVSEAVENLNSNIAQLEEIKSLLKEIKIIAVKEPSFEKVLLCRDIERNVGTLIDLFAKISI